MTAVYLVCPSCSRTWLAALIDPFAWWGKGVSLESIAGRCYCRCGQNPPMRVMSSDRLELF